MRQKPSYHPPSLSIFILQNSKHFRLGIDGLAKGSRTRVVRCAYHKVAFSEHTLAHYAESLRKFLAIALRPLFEVGFLFEESTKLCKHVDFGTRFFCISVWHIVIIRALGNVLVGLGLLRYRVRAYESVESRVYAVDSFPLRGIYQLWRDVSYQ
jgi:hypothetical protein